MNQKLSHVRSVALEALVYAGINHFPVDLHKIACKYQVKIITYSELNLHSFCGEVAKADGFTTWLNDQQTIFLNDTKGTLGRQRFILAHELGHVLLNHDFTYTKYNHPNNFNNMTEIEACADMFAKELLMPIYLLEKFQITQVRDIAHTCMVSYPMAKLREKQLRSIHVHRKFEHLHLKKKLLKNFDAAINIT